MLPIFVGKLVLLANYYISEIFMEIPKISALKNFVVRVADEINHWVVLISRNLQSTLDEVFHVGS
ncbi:MAG: hypothetical protein PUP90_16035 [Nostoc sp. S4]|nr:hypothetical protein [Nostoc sp. S4]